VEGFTDIAVGRYQEALAVFQASATPVRLQGIAMAQYGLGNRAASDQAMDQFIKERGRSFAYQYVQVYAFRGDTDKAFEWLDIGYQIHDGGLAYLTYDYCLKSIRGDPRFTELLRKVNLAQVKENEHS
jgi:hypothetical protein